MSTLDAPAAGTTTDDAMADDAITDEALSLLVAHGGSDGTVGLVQLQRIIADLDSLHGWKHTIPEVVQLWKEKTGDPGTRTIDLRGLVTLLRGLHGRVEQVPSRTQRTSSVHHASSTRSSAAIAALLRKEEQDEAARSAAHTP
eukprot:CAMPEP_0174700896 /NCGR_PEP_ID=MMETSP1094-20130205/5716_1 /TAXON_ID=156173 /ORGANISM="Chrysochromulina brevifilum, Strain UTEX LB 985" /LENGTH=142 /DNA_ID=CAMNT_0015898461 /DNA_START=14 /DNA_END=438 /DNA_ORIENTATION=-